MLDIKNGDDVRDFRTCVSYCEGVDEVYHLFGIKGSPYMTQKEPATFMQMLQGDANMIYAAQSEGVKKFLYTSSITVNYPDVDVYPAWVKSTAEKLIEAHKIEYPNGTKFTIVRPASVYGRFDDFKNKNAMVIPSLISKSIQPYEKFLEIWGDGTQVRDFINSKDVAKGMIKCMDEMPEYPVNLCSGKGITIKKVAELIAKQTNKKIKYIPIKNQIMGAQKRVMKKNYDFGELIDIETGIKEVIDYLKNDRT